MHTRGDGDHDKTTDDKKQINTGNTNTQESGKQYVKLAVFNFNRQ